jgi:hypothetical protein
MLFADDKFEKKLSTYRNYTMASLIARRMHKTCRKWPEYKALGLRFITSNSNDRTVLYVGSTKVRALDTETIKRLQVLAGTYASILEPFYSR